jgi:hypothetical protein
MSADINADFAHNGDRFRAHEAGFRARAFYFEALSVIVPQQTFGHLTPCELPVQRINTRVLSLILNAVSMAAAAMPRLLLIEDQSLHRSQIFRDL